jgi:hypothetical protein
MAMTMEELKGPTQTWAQEMKNQETLKRRVVDEGLVSGQQVRLMPGAVQNQERQFDPLLQRFRDNGTEGERRLGEERQRVAHLNRAMDIQVVREQPFNIVNHTSRFEALAPGTDPERCNERGPVPRSTKGTAQGPTSAYDFNIVSNIGHDEHHWARPEDRPRQHAREPKHRTVPTFLNKDFHIISNKYLDDHDDRIQTEKRLRLLEATQKHAKQNRFDPVMQTFADPRHEECVRAADHALQAEINMRAHHQLPPSYKGRESNFYDMVNHKVHDKPMIKLISTQEKERSKRYENRHIVEHNLHVQDIKQDHIVNSRKIQRIAPERFNEERDRGYNIIDNKAHGLGPKEKQFHHSFVKDRLSPWDRAHEQSSRAQGAPDGDKHITQKISKVASAPQLNARRGERADDMISVRSRRSNASGMSRASMQSLRPDMGARPDMVTTIKLPPPPPSLPGGGSGAGSVYSRPSRA